MTQYTIKILGAQFAANPDYKFGDPETEEICGRTIDMLTKLKNTKPRVVLKPEPENIHDEKAVMARAKGKKIGYVNRDQQNEVRKLLRRSKRGMLCAEVGEVVIYKHGFLYITVQSDDATTTADVQETGFDWREWHTDMPLLLPSDALNAEEEAAFILEEELLPNLNDADLEELQTYLNIWMEGSRHDMSQEASSQRRQYIRLLAESERSEVRLLAKELEHQSASMCCRHRLEERVLEWWPCLVDSDEMENLWVHWHEQINGRLWDGLRLIDEKLRQLPGNLYESIGHLETVFSQLYYLCIPRATLTSVLALLALRVKTCRQLGIEMKPMAQADYADDASDGNSISMNDFAESFKKYPINIALSLYSGVSTLLAWHPSWQKNSPKFHQQILAKAQEQQDKQEQKQDKMIEEVKKVANKPTTQNIYGDKNDFQSGAQLLKMGIPKGTDPAKIAARIAELQRALPTQNEPNKDNE